MLVWWAIELFGNSFIIEAIISNKSFESLDEKGTATRGWIKNFY